ncbi:MAG: metal ABC transporter ATP-binding protein [Paracoccaceae bacterium]
MLLGCEGLAVRLGGRDVLHGVDFALQPGEIVTVIGPNGSGKSTLLRALIGARPLSGGRLTRKDGLKIGYVPQRLDLDRTMPVTVGRFLCLPRRYPGEAVANALARVGADGLEKRQMTQLSGGQFQRVLLARAILAEPDLLVLDEPTQGLDQPAIAAFYAMIEDLRRALGCAVLMVSHELHVVMRASDRVICLNGHVCCQGTPIVVSEDPQYRALFGSDRGALAFYEHQHDHSHDHPHDHAHPKAGATH